MTAIAAPGERFRATGIVTDVVASGAAVMAAALAVEDGVAGAAPIGACFAILFAIARIVSGEITTEADRETSRARIRSRQLLALYTSSAGAFLALFPEILPPVTLYFFSAMQVALLALAADSRVRGAAEWNALLIVGGANAVGGAGTAACTAVWLVAMAMGLAVRRAESASLDAGARGADRIGLPLLFGAVFGGTLALVYGGAVVLAGAPGGVRAPSWLESEHPAREAAGRISDRVRLEMVVRLGLFIVATVVLFWLAARVRGRFRAARAARRREALPGEMGFDQPVPLPPKLAAHGFPGDSARGRVVAEYLRYEEALSERGLSRPRERGASAHAAWIGGRIQRAMSACADVARRFAGARYGPDEPPRDAALDLRKAAGEALHAIGLAEREA